MKKTKRKYEELMNINDLCRFFGIGKSCIYKHIMDGRLPHLNVGSRLKTSSRTEIEKYLEIQKVR